MESGLAQPEAQLSEDALALPHCQGNAIALAQVFGEHFAVPEMASAATFPRVASQVAPQRRPLFRIQRCRPARTIASAHPLKPAGFEPLDPALHRAPIFAKQLGDLLAALAVLNQQQTIQPMVAARLIGARNLLLDGDSHHFRIGNCQFSHDRTSATMSSHRIVQ